MRRPGDLNHAARAKGISSQGDQTQACNRPTSCTWDEKLELPSKKGFSAPGLSLLLSSLFGNRMQKHTVFPTFRPAFQYFLLIYEHFFPIIKIVYDVCNLENSEKI